MSARKEVEASTLTGTESLFGADPHEVRKRAARAIHPIMELKILFIYNPFLSPTIGEG